MASPRRDCLSVVLIYLALTAAAEYAVITYLLLPLPSTRFDWQFGTGIIAPGSAALLLLVAATIVRIVADVLAFCAWMTRHITGAQR